MTSKKPEPLTSYIKHLAVSGLSNVSARIKRSFSLTGKCFEMPNVSYTYPLWASEIKKRKRKKRTYHSVGAVRQLAKDSH